MALLLAEQVWGTTLHASRSLTGAGAEVLVAVADGGASIYRSSRACSAAVEIPADDPTSYCRAVRDWTNATIGAERNVVVIPLSDRLVDHLNANRELFPERFRLAIAGSGSLEALLDKRSALRIAAKANLDVPAWEAIGAGCEMPLRDGASKLLEQGPVAVKPARWTVPGPGYFKVAVIHDDEELEALAADSAERGISLVAQHYVRAPEDAVEFGILWRSADGSRTIVCTGRKRRQSAPEGGVMVWGETVELADVSDAAIRFLDESGFTGPGGIEFIRTDSGLWFIEFNPRLEAIHFLAAAAGVDTVTMTYADHAGGDVTDPPPRQRHASAWLGSAWLERLRVDRSYRRLALRDRLEWSRRPVHVRAIWSWTDPQPGLRVGARLISKLSRASLDRIQIARSER